MPASLNPIIETSMELLATYPNSPALEILHQAMKGHRNSSPDFESFDPVTGAGPHPAYDDETDASSPFGELLRRAFGPRIDPRELMLLRLTEGRDEPSISRRINAVSLAF